MMGPAYRCDVAQTRSASPVVGHGVIGVAAHSGPAATGIGAGGMADFHQVAQGRGRPVCGRLPDVITAFASQQCEAEGPGPFGCAGPGSARFARPRSVARGAGGAGPAVSARSVTSGGGRAGTG